MEGTLLLVFSYTPKSFLQVASYTLKARSIVPIYCALPEDCLIWIAPVHVRIHCAIVFLTKLELVYDKFVLKFQTLVGCQKRPRQGCRPRSSLIRVFPVYYSVNLTSILRRQALITNIFYFYMLRTEIEKC